MDNSSAKGERPQEKKKKILLRMCKMSGREMEFIEEAFREEWVVPLGPNVNAFEEDLERFLGDGKVVALSAGTAALHLALILAGVKAGDEVMVQSFTFSASANPVAYLGARPVFVDSEPETWNMDPRLLEEGIRSRLEATGNLPKAIVVVDLYGMPARLGEISAIARKWNIPLIEDAAEAFGSSFDGRRCGTFGDFGILSFNGNKMITTSGGGALVCHSPELKKRALYLATQARKGYAYYQHEEIGFNYRLSNISAGIGRGQMTAVEEYLAHHRHRMQYYREKFAAIPGIILHDNHSPEFDSNFWLCTVTLSPDLHVKGADRAYADKIQGTIGGAGGVTGEVADTQTDCQPDADIEALRIRLADENIESRPLWKPMHRQPVFNGAPVFGGDVSESIFRRGICLPSGPWVTDEDADRVVETILDSLV